MPKQARVSTKYPGVYYINNDGARGPERTYYIAYRLNGKRIEEKAGHSTVDHMTDAQANRIRSDRIRGKELPNTVKRDEAKAEVVTISTIWNKYKENKANIKGMAQDDNRFKLHIAPTMGNKQPSELVPLDIDRLRIGLGKKAAPGTVKNVLELLRRLINFAGQKQLCTIPAWKIKIPGVNNMKTEDLTPGQMARLLNVLNSEIITLPDGTQHFINADARDAMRLALATGMRRSEIFSLQWEDIDERRRVITIRNPKGGIDQFIPLPDAAIEVFKQRIKSPSPFVFPSNKNGHRTEAGRQMRLIREAAGLPKDFRPMHGLRHTFASTLASSGEVDLYTIQRLLTHKSPIMTQRYAHLRDETMRKASNLAGKIIKQAAAVKEEQKQTEATA